MIFIIVDRNTLEVYGNYESDVKSDSSADRSWLRAEPKCIHLEVPEGLDKDCVTAILNGETIELIADPVKVAAKVLADKQSRIDALNAATWNTIIAQAKSIYGFRATDRNEAAILILATHSTYESMVSTPLAYVGDIFADQAAVLAYAEPKLASSLEFGKWRLGVLAAEAVQVAAIEAE